MNDDEPKPRPQYGEYASASEQQAHIREPLAEPVPLIPPAREHPTRVTGQRADLGSARRQPGANDRPLGAPGAPGAPGAQKRRVDRFVTFGLLALGALNVFTSLPTLLDLAATIKRTYALMGVEGEFTNFDAAKTWGMIAAVVVLLSYVITFALTWRRMKVHKTTWWFVLVCAVVSYLVVAVCISVPLSGDPAFIESVQQGVASL